MRYLAGLHKIPLNFFEKSANNNILSAFAPKGGCEWKTKKKKKARSLVMKERFIQKTTGTFSELLLIKYSSRSP